VRREKRAREREISIDIISSFSSLAKRRELSLEFVGVFSTLSHSFPALNLCSIYQEHISRRRSRPEKSPRLTLPAQLPPTGHRPPSTPTRATTTTTTTTPRDTTRCPPCKHRHTTARRRRRPRCRRGALRL
jgi:hypothetical protein